MIEWGSVVLGSLATLAGVAIREVFAGRFAQSLSRKQWQRSVVIDLLAATQELDTQTYRLFEMAREGISLPELPDGPFRDASRKLRATAALTLDDRLRTLADEQRKTAWGPSVLAFSHQGRADANAVRKAFDNLAARVPEVLKALA
ncbi:MAG TPA: hypothetical protein VNU19_14685 [Candidatus Acidoferrum sp.]|nr:hypothetical protein [Candidatus Acidoferrum sp.]